MLGFSGGVFGVPKGIRTPDLSLRRRTLYPTELLAHNITIVYDRFHMQSQFGRDVLGVVRLDEARRLKAKEKEILADISDDTDKETMKSLKQEAMLVITY